MKKIVKARVLKPFYFAKDKELYLDENRYNELKKLGLVEKIEVVEYATQNKTKVETSIRNKAFEIKEGYNKKGGINPTIPDFTIPAPPAPNSMNK